MAQSNRIEALAVIGFGEAAGAFLAGWQGADGVRMPDRITAHDRKSDAPDSRVLSGCRASISMVTGPVPPAIRSRVPVAGNV